MNLLIAILQTIPILFWHGIPAENTETLMPMLAQTGADIYLNNYADAAACLSALDIAEKNGVKMIAAYPAFRENPEAEYNKIRNHPAFAGYYIKDEPETWDIDSLARLVSRIQAVDRETPCYINLYPNWAWQEDKYADHIELFASSVNVPFYSFDQYPVTEKDGKIVIRPGWYRNLEEFSAMARRHGKPFWAFALTESHHLGAPSPEAFYPVPTMGHLRLQVYSDLLYGAQVIQYYNFRGIYEKGTLAKTPVFDLVKQMNAEIKFYSKVFLGCDVKGVWHTGKEIPAYTKRLDVSDIPYLNQLDIDSAGAVVSLLENGGVRYMAVQNRDCERKATLNVCFAKTVGIIRMESGKTKLRRGNVTMDAGDIIIFRIN